MPGFIQAWYSPVGDPGRMIVIYSIKILWLLLKTQIRSQTQYRLSFLADVFTTAIFSSIYFLAFALILQRFETVAGWTLGEIAFLVGMTETSFAFMDLLFSGFDPDSFSPMVRMGSLDQFMVRPVSLTIQVLGSRLILRRLGRVLEGLAVLAFGIVTTQPDWTWLKTFYLPVVLVCQVICMGSIFMMGSTITFWTVERIEAVNILTYGGNELMSYPMNIYPRWLLFIFTYFVPFIFVNFYPTLYFLDKPDPLNFPVFAPFLTPLVAIGMALAAYWFWGYGLRHYQSTGT